MSEMVTPSPEPAYITRMALQASPFTAGGSDDLFFKGVHYEQRLNLLLHLLRATDKVANVVAEPGLGKTALLNQLERQLSETSRFCRIDADKTYSLNNILLPVLKAYGFKDQDLTENQDLSQLLLQRLAQLRKINLIPVLLIDNFDKLSAEVTEQIFDWLRWQEDGNYLLQAVLTSQRPVKQSLLAERLLQVDLPLLAQDEVIAYLTYRLSAVGFQDELPFDSKTLRQFYKQSKGNPVKLNQLAHQHLLGFQPAARPSIISFLRSFFRQGIRWIGVLLLVVLVSALLIYQNEINRWVKAGKKTDEQKVETLNLHDNEKMPTIVVGKDTVVDADKAEREELQQLVSQIPPTPTPKINPEKETKPVVQQPTDSAPVQATPATKPVNAESATDNKSKPGKNTLYHSDWIMQQAAEKYTFQLMGSWDKQEVSDFIEKYALAGDVAEFESLRNGRIWYALIYGVYDSKQAALDASKSWPAPLNTLPTWLRRFDSVQKQITNKAPSP